MSSPTVSTDILKYNPQMERFECDISHLNWKEEEGMPFNFILLNPNTGIKEELILVQACYEESILKAWRYESDRYKALIRNI